ncbi:MAG: HAMP domain-containing histidine kinase [Lachnospiraceae bacterium]|nr:HAMP domain-containing histidine kinase [Lachnospiraceae bacterium]
MRKKIKNSLSVKVFLWVFSALTICSMLIYGIVLTVLPKQYQVTSDKQLDANTEFLVSKLQGMRYEEAVNEIYNFCIQNNSTAILSDDNGAMSFGEIKTEELTVATSSIATTVIFSDSKTEYALIISSLSQTADVILSLMLRFLPVVFVIILLLSSLSAFICSKVIVSPIAKISQISKRMTLLDMTWKCDIESNDEIGVLASSLNTMASRLQTTMEELENANKQLTADVKKFQTLEGQRRNFFAAVSHELKTPLTILKGQIENMMLGYGDYQNHEKYLPEALKATEDIECLVKEIITISKMESMDLEDTLQEVSLKQTINDTIQAILPLAQDKDIQIHQNISTDMVLSINLGLWNKALSNIVGNAVRHSPCGKDVFITLQSSETRNALVIENTGVIIPETDLSHMFTPFYRADKSRNKATGGSGLGLYIVKTILDLHGMTYCIKNTEQGVAFSLYLN